MTRRDNKIQFRLTPEELERVESFSRDGESLSQTAKRLLLDGIALLWEDEVTLGSLAIEVSMLKADLGSDLKQIDTRLERIEQSQAKKSKKGFG